MTDWIAQNGLGGEAIIWLIIAFFWVVAQLVSRAKEKTARQQYSKPRESTTSDREWEPPPKKHEPSLEEEMRRFFESIGAEEPAEEAVPPPPPRRPAGQTVRREPPQPPIHIVARDREPVPMPTPDLENVRLGDIDTRIDESVLDTDRAYALPDHRIDENINAFVNPRTLLVNLNYLRMNMPLIPVAGLDTAQGSRHRPTLHGRKALREAIVTQLILSNPLAMGEDKGSYTKRLV